MALLELLLLTLKILLLAALYATGTRAVLFGLVKITGRKWTKKAWTLLWRSIYAVSIVLLFAAAFSYRQDTGLGDNSKIPVGYGQTVQSEDFAWTYFYPDPGKTEPNRDELVIEEYAIAGPLLCAAVSHQFTGSPDYDYVVYDLRSKSLRTFRTRTDYTGYAAIQALPDPTTFYGFERHYQEYLAGRPWWRTWLLP